jgi:hypothetical protein
VNVPAGTDRVVFRYRGYGDYPGLFALSGLTLALLVAAQLFPALPGRVRGRHPWPRSGRDRDAR